MPASRTTVPPCRRLCACSPAAPSASTCWSGWKTNWKRPLAAGTDAETLAAQAGSLLGSGNDEASAVLAALGWRLVEVAGAPVWLAQSEKPTPSRTPAEKPPPPGQFAFRRPGRC